MNVTIQDMLQVRTAAYRPPLTYKPTFIQTGLPPFTLTTIEWMRRDPQVRLSMATKLAPFQVVKLTLKGDPATCQFMASMIRMFWTRAMPKITRAFWYTMSGGEMIYRYHDQRLDFWNYNDVYPSDLNILSRDGVPVGISIRPSREPQPNFGDSSTSTISQRSGNTSNFAGDNNRIRLFAPKGFLYIHGREFGSLTGQSEFEAAYDPWLEKNDYQGAKHARKLWFYKNAYSGGIMFHPPGNFRDEQNNEIPYQDLARQAMEQSLNGAIWTIAQAYDPVTKQPMWQYVEPKVNPGGRELLEYVKHLDNEIARGMGIPDDVMQQISGTGAYAGRTIPLMSFFLSSAPVLSNLFSVCDEQVFRPFCRFVCGSDDYEGQVDVDIERILGTATGESQGGNHPPHPNDEVEGAEPVDLEKDAEASRPGEKPKASQFSNRSSQQAVNNTLEAVNRAGYGMTTGQFIDPIRCFYQDGSTQHLLAP